MNSANVIPVGGLLPKPARVNPKAPSPHAVRRQLSAILSSESFVHAERMKCFLEFVVEETLAGRSHQLREYSIGTSVFGRDQSFEPGIDPIVRNDARRLRQKLLEYYQGSHRKDDEQVVIEIRKGTYVPSFRYASQPEPAGEEKYRLMIKLIRISDGAEIWAVQHDY